MAYSPELHTGADGQPFVTIEEKHGEDCTCQAAGRIEVDLVMASSACPGDRDPRRADTITAQIDEIAPPWYPGRITITWGGPDPRGWQTIVHDADTGQLLPVSTLRLALDAGAPEFKGPITAVARMLVDHNRQPLIGDRAGIPYPDPDGTGRWASREFRCQVAEMRTAAHGLDDGLLPPHENTDAEIHNFPALDQPGKYGPCSCGRTL